MIPVSLVTGFLGSGKTTLIARLLQQPGFDGTLVIVNEFGEVGIDHALLEASSDDTILLANGCLCCTIRGNLLDTLLDLQQQREQGRVGSFDRIVVETSGVADPAPVLGFVFGDPRVAALYSLGAVITTVDAIAGAALLDRQPEAVSQVAVADQLLITKPDLMGDTQALAERLRSLNATASIRDSMQGEGLDPALLGAPHLGTGHGHHHHHDHTDRFTPTVLHARPLFQAELAPLAAAIDSAADAAMLRLKGLLPLADAPGYAVIQAAPGTVHPPVVVQGPPPDIGRIMLITEGPPSPAILAALGQFGIVIALHAPD